MAAILEVAYGSKIQFFDSNSIVWSAKKRNDCLYEVKAEAVLKPCSTLLTGINLNVTPDSVTAKDTICSAIAKLQSQIDSIELGEGSVLSVGANNLNPLFTTSVANPTTTPVISFAAISQNANLFYASPDGVAGIPLFREIVNTDLGTGANGTKFLRDDMTWQTVSGTIAEPNTQIVYGTGAAVDSSSQLTFDVATNIFTLLDINANYGIFKSDSQYEMNVYFVDATYDIGGSFSMDAGTGISSWGIVVDDSVTKQGAKIQLTAYPLADAGVALMYQENLVQSPILFITKDHVALKGFDGTSVANSFRFYEGNTAVGGNYFAIKATDTITNTRTLVLPNDDPAIGEVWTVTSYAGNVIVTEWAAASALIAQPQNQIVFGTGASVSSSANFLYQADDYFQVFDTAGFHLVMDTGDQTFHLQNGANIFFRWDDSTNEIEFGDTSNPGGTKFYMNYSGNVVSLTLAGQNIMQWDTTGVTLKPFGATSDDTYALIFADLDESHSIGFQAPDVVTASVVWKLPASDSTGTQALVSNGGGVLSWSSVQASDATLTALAAYNTNGLLTQTAPDTFTGRTIVGTANEITVTNGDGVSGNPTLSLPAALTFTGKTVTGGTFTAPTINVNDNVFSVRDNGDTTKIVQFQVSGVSTGTTRTLAVPDADGQIALTVSGSANRIAMYQDANTLTLSELYQNSNWIGIGAVPIALFDVALGSDHFLLIDPDNKEVILGSEGASAYILIDWNSGFYRFNAAAFEINTISYTFPGSQGAAGSTLRNDGSGGLTWVTFQPLDATLTALAAYNTNGLLTQTAADTFTGRTITGTANEITVTNGDGVSGNPTVSLPASISFSGKSITGGTWSSMTTFTVRDNSLVIQDNLDLTKIMQFQLSGISTGTTRILTVPNADGTIALTSDLAAYQPLDATLTALAAYNTNGLITQTAADTFTGRTITGTSNRIDVTNGNGVSGNPTIDISSSYVGQATITTLGTITTGVWNGTQLATAFIADNAVTDAKLRDSAAVSVIGRSANSAGDPADIAAASNDTILRRVGNALDFGQITIGMIPDTTITEAKFNLSDNTTADVTSTKHGLAPKSPGDSTKVLKGGATPAWDFLNNADLPDTSKYIAYETDLTHGGNNVRDSWIDSNNSGTNAGVTSVAATGNHIGIMQCSTGTTATGRSALAGANDSIEPANGTVSFEAIIRIPTLSDGTETYTVRVGLINSFTGESTDGCFFRYTHSVNSGKFEIVSRKASAETAADSAQTVVANTWYKLRVEINAAANSVSFYINDAQVGSAIVTNVPNTSSNKFGFGMMILKSAGLTARTIQADLYDLKITLTTTR